MYFWFLKHFDRLIVNNINGNKNSHLVFYFNNEIN